MEEWLQIIFKFLISFMVPLLRDGLSRTCNVTGYILSQHNQGTFTPPVIPSPPPPIPLGKRNKTLITHINRFNVSDQVSLDWTAWPTEFLLHLFLYSGLIVLDWIENRFSLFYMWQWKTNSKCIDRQAAWKLRRKSNLHQFVNSNINCLMLK